MEFHDDGVSTVSSQYAIPANFEGYPGIAHGGIVAAILDEVVARAALAVDPNHFMMTVKIEIKYRQRVPVETPLTLIGRKLKQRGRLCLANGELHLPDGSIAAEASATLADLPQDLITDAELSSLGWRVYP
jgi:acyl-coenzyme A thioesterase PaaI-like protein